MICVADDDPDIDAFFPRYCRMPLRSCINLATALTRCALTREDRPDVMTLDAVDAGERRRSKKPTRCNTGSALKSVPVCIITGKRELRRLIYRRAVPPPEYLDRAGRRAAVADECPEDSGAVAAQWRAEDPGLSPGTLCERLWQDWLNAVAKPSQVLRSLTVPTTRKHPPPRHS